MAARTSGATPKLSPEDQALWDALGAVTRGIFRHLQQGLRQRGVTVPQFWTLRTLALHGPVPSGKLSLWMDVTLPTVTGIVDHLETLGFVARTPSPEDRRLVLVRLTP